MRGTQEAILPLVVTLRRPEKNTSHVCTGHRPVPQMRRRHIRILWIGRNASIKKKTRGLDGAPIGNSQGRKPFGGGQLSRLRDFTSHLVCFHPGKISDLAGMSLSVDTHSHQRNTSGGRGGEALLVEMVTSKRQGAEWLQPGSRAEDKCMAVGKEGGVVERRNVRTK